MDDQGVLEGPIHRMTLRRDHAVDVAEMAMAPLADGRALMVFETYLGSDIYAAALSAEGALDGLPTRIGEGSRDDDYRHDDLAVAAAPNGEAVAAWIDPGGYGGPTVFHVQRLSDDGAPIGGTVELVPGGVRPDDGRDTDIAIEGLTALASGEIVLTWSESSWTGEGTTLRAQTLLTEDSERVTLAGPGGRRAVGGRGATTCSWAWTATTC